MSGQRTAGSLRIKNLLPQFRSKPALPLKPPTIRHLQTIDPLARTLDATPLQLVAERLVDLEVTQVDATGPIETLTMSEARDLASLIEGDLIASRYQVERMLGRGGIGKVYLCTDLKTNAQVTVKTSLLPELEKHITAESDTYRALGRGRKNIVDCLATGENMIVLEFVQGEALTDFIINRPMTSVESIFQDHVIAALGIISDVFRGLEYAHDRGVVHADLSPDNILLTRGERGKKEVTIIDWGLGRAYPDREPGMMMGKPMYASPEQLRGEDIDLQTDIFQAGLVLNEMLTGRRPFRESSILVLIRRRLSGEAFETAGWTKSFAPLNRDLTLTIQNLILRMTGERRSEEEPGNGLVRFQSALEARLAVEKILAEIRPVASPLPPPNISPLD
ncbi:MAG: serine/threonine protein kinase [Candidatus Margulisbacteria bacterium]|nr:serine/threonine protein kinase [Candidatus Margulisiibacteriota bacterium]